MKVKTFHALTMQDALREIKQELGPDAIILSSKEVREDGRMVRLFNRPILEIMAACEQPPEQAIPSSREEMPDAKVDRYPSPQATPASAGQGFQETLQAILNPASLGEERSRGKHAVRTAALMPAGWKRTRLRELRAELYELSRLLGGAPQDVSSAEVPVPPALTTLRHSLAQQGMRPSTADSLGRDVLRIMEPDSPCSHGDIGTAFQHTLARRITVNESLFGDGRRRAVVLMLGPSGAGKTSAVAKLAARCRREWNRSVAVVAFEAGLAEPNGPLHRYARELGMPFASARSARQLAEGVRRHTRADLFVIDMPNLGSGGSTQAETLCGLLGDEWEISTHLVVPASAREQELRRMAEQASRLPSLRWFFTRLDETESFGTIAELGCRTAIPLSYWSIGRRVPEDIEPASPKRLAEWLMAQRSLTSSGSAHQQTAPSPKTAEQEPAEVCLQSNE
jgi:flagellar biosynthesis protein FlhF